MLYMLEIFLYENQLMYKLYPGGIHFSSEKPWIENVWN